MAIAFYASAWTTSPRPNARVDRSPSRAHGTTIAGTIRSLDAPFMTIDDAHNRFVNVLTDAHTMVSRSQPARSIDIAAGEYVVVVGTLDGPDFAARWIIDEESPTLHRYR